MSALRMADADLVKQGADAEVSLMILQTQPPGQPQVLPRPQDHADDQLMPKGSGSMNQGADATQLHTQWTGFQNGLFYASSLGADSQSHWRYYTACLRAGFCLPAQHQDLNQNHADNQRMPMREDFMIQDHEEYLGRPIFHVACLGADYQAFYLSPQHQGSLNQNDADHQQMPMCLGFMVQGMEYSLPADLQPIQGGPLLNEAARLRLQPLTGKIVRDLRKDFDSGFFDGPLRTGYSIGFHVGGLLNELFVTQRAATVVMDNQNLSTKIGSI